MISCIQPRRYGKSTALLEQARKEKDSLVVSFSSPSTRVLYNLAELIFSKEIDYTIFIPNRIVFKDGNTMSFTWYELYKPNKMPTFIDELPYILEKMFGDVKMFTGTCDRMDLEPDHLPEDWVESRKM